MSFCPVHDCSVVLQSIKRDDYAVLDNLRVDIRYYTQVFGNDHYDLNTLALFLHVRPAQHCNHQMLYLQDFDSLNFHA